MLSFLNETLKELHYLLNQLNSWCQVKTKVNELPLDSFLAVLLLLMNKHVMIEELLKLLVGEVDAQLLKSVQL